MTTYPPLPTPGQPSPPNVPSDLGAVALAVESQALAQYNVYNTTNSPSATSIESRLSAVDNPATGTAPALNSRIAALNGTINTWTAGAASTLSAQIARTNAYPIRQNSHDSTMTSLNSQLAALEPQITTLVSQRPGGVVAFSQGGAFYNMQNSRGYLLHFTITARANAWYRLVFNGFVQSTVGQVPQWADFYWVGSPGSSPSTSGAILGGANTPMGAFTGNVGATCYGLSAPVGAGQYTFTLAASLSHSTQTAGAQVIGLYCASVEDIGWRYF